MAKFKKKAGRVDAEKISDLIADASEKGTKKLPDWVKAAFDRGDISFSGTHVIVSTSEGSMSGNPDDFLVLGTAGNLLLRSGTVFAEDYEVE